MSKVKPLTFAVVEDEVSTPRWLGQAAPRVTVAPFAKQAPEEAEYEQGAPYAPSPEESHAEPGMAKGESQARPSLHSLSPEAPPLRRSMLPSRSIAPPPVSISRHPDSMAEESPEGEAEEQVPAEASEEQRAFAQAALELASLRARTLLSVESELLELSVNIASAIVEREIEADPSILAALGKAAISALGDTSSARLRASGDAYRAISEVYGEAALDVDGVRVELVLDHSLAGLGVYAEAGASRVDGRVSERLSAVLRALEAEHRRTAAEEDL